MAGLGVKVLLALLALAIAVPLVLNVLVGIVRLVFWGILLAVVVALVVAFLRRDRPKP